jgi:UDP-3-O-acyl-N-acetylglucosamine deacetylase
VVLFADAPSSPFRFDNEVARHKALDVLGDVALLFGADGGTLNAHLVAIRGGHGPHRAWMEAARSSGALVRRA